MSLLSGLSALFRLRGGTNAYSDTIISDIDRANVRFFLPEDSRFYVTDWSRTRLLEKAEWLYQNFPIVKEMGEGGARHTIGKGISLQLETLDRPWNKEAEPDFESYALTADRCDVSARRNLYEGQLHAVEQFMFRGEFMATFAENPRWPSPVGNLPGCPAFWMVDTNDVQTPRLLQDTQWAGRNIIDGVELGSYGEAKNFFVRIAGEMAFNPIPASQFCHWFKPHATNQIRGITPFAQAVNCLVDVHELRRLTTRVAKAQQLIAMVVKGLNKTPKAGAFGSIENMAATLGADPTAAGTQDIEKMGKRAGAGIAYVGDNGDVKIVSSSSPNPLVEPFIRDLLIRDASLAAGLPMEFFWDPSKLGGANTRFVLGRADLLFQVLADSLIYRFLTPLAVRYLSWRMETGMLPKCKDPNWMNKISWQLPARLTVDNGREGALDIAKLRAGMLNLRAYYNARGMNWHTELAQRIRELQELKSMCEEADMPELFQYFVALDPGAQLLQSKADEQNQVDDDGKGEAKAA